MGDQCAFNLRAEQFTHDVPRHSCAPDARCRANLHRWDRAQGCAGRQGRAKRGVRRDARARVGAAPEQARNFLLPGCAAAKRPPHLRPCAQPFSHLLYEDRSSACPLHQMGPWRKNVRMCSSACQGEEWWRRAERPTLQADDCTVVQAKHKDTVGDPHTLEQVEQPLLHPNRNTALRESHTVRESLTPQFQAQSPGSPSTSGWLGTGWGGLVEIACLIPCLYKPAPPLTCSSAQ